MLKTTEETLKDAILDQEGIVHIHGEGRPDSVIRVLNVPDDFFDKGILERGSQFRQGDRCTSPDCSYKEQTGGKWHWGINKDYGPGLEKYKAFERMLFLHAPRDRGLAQPIQMGDYTRLTISPEDVPVVDIGGEKVKASRVPDASSAPDKTVDETRLKCPFCARCFEKKHGLKIHLNQCKEKDVEHGA